MVLGRAAFLFALLAMPALVHAQAPPTAPKAVAPAAKATQPAAPPQQAAPAPTAATPAATSEESEATASAERAIERTKARIQELEARTDVAPAIRDQALALLRNALGHLEASSASAAAAVRFQESAQRSPERVAEAKQQLEALHKEAGEAEFTKKVDQLPLAEAQQAFDAANAAAATIKTDLDQLETPLARDGYARHVRA